MFFFFFLLIACVDARKHARMLTWNAWIFILSRWEKKRKCYLCKENRKEEKKQGEKKTTCCCCFSHNVLIASCSSKTFPHNSPAQRNEGKKIYRCIRYFQITTCFVPRYRQLLCYIFRESIIRNHFFSDECS